MVEEGSTNKTATKVISYWEYLIYHIYLNLLIFRLKHKDLKQFIYGPLEM